jgi:hypothetical protein
MLDNTNITTGVMWYNINKNVHDNTYRKIINDGMVIESQSVESNKEEKKLSQDEFYYDIIPLLKRCIDKSFEAIMYIIRELFKETQLPKSCEDDFNRDIISVIEYYKREQKIASLPTNPLREYQPRESVIDYIRARDGLGPWLEAKVLTRPLMKKLSPKAYMALANWLRNPKNTLEGVGLNIPTKSEVIDQELSADPDALRNASRLERVQRYRKYEARKLEHNG